MSTVTALGPRCGNPHCDRRMLPGKTHCCNRCALSALVLNRPPLHHTPNCPAAWLPEPPR